MKMAGGVVIGATRRKTRHMLETEEEESHEGTDNTEPVGSPSPKTKFNHSNFYDLPEPIANRLNYDEIGSRGRELNILDSQEDPGPIKKKFLPFFRKFWPHLGSESSASSKNDDKAYDQTSTIFGKALEEVDPFVFEDVSTI